MKPTKLAARRMFEMTRYINSAWATHVNPAGVTCYTCHRGQPVPAEVWWPRIPAPVKAFVDRRDHWNEAADTVSTFFPNAGYANITCRTIRSRHNRPPRCAPTTSPKSSCRTRIYEMMMQYSLSIGVNCNYCHLNTSVFEDWKQSTPMRWTGYYALRFIRDLNRNYLLPLAQIIPQQRSLVHPPPCP